MNLLQCTKTILIAYALILFNQNSHAMGEANPLLNKVTAEIELLPSRSGNSLEWDIDAWRGRDLHKVWIKTSGEVTRQKLNTSSNTTELEKANIELVFSRAFTANWDQQFGLRHDFKPDEQTNNSPTPNKTEQRNWLSVGYIGTAPYFVLVDARIFIGEQSSSQILIELERELMLSQDWVLTPELDIKMNGRTNALFNEGSGLAEVEFSLRLGYEHNGNRKFQPFLSISGEQYFAGTKRFNHAIGKKSVDLKATLGLHFWF